MVLFGLAVLLLAGCSSGSEGASPSGSVDASQPASDTGASTEPVKEEAKPTLKFLGISGNFDPNKEPIVEDIKRLTGYNVEYYNLPSDKADEKLNIEVASGTDKDILILRPNQYAQLSTQGALADLSELVDKYGPNIKQAVSEESRALTTLDGALYGIPYMQQNLNFPNGFEVRTDIMKE